MIGSLVIPNISFMLEFLDVSSCVESCLDFNVLVGKASYFGVVSFIDSK
jgi:hypothetical protein